MKRDINKTKENMDNQRRLEMYRKARADTKHEQAEENEANYQKRLSQMEKKDKGEVVEDSWLMGMKAHNVDNE